jgi:hypothetical protein
MTSTASTRLRLDKQATGDNPDAWGERLNGVIDLVDEAFGFAEIAVNGNVVLSVANFTSDQARRMVLRFTGAGGFSVTIPAVEKMFYIDNRCPADVVLKTATTPGSAVVAFTKRIAYCDGATVTTDTSSAAPSASGVAFNPTGTIASTNVQGAIAEVANERVQQGTGVGQLSANVIKIGWDGVDQLKATVDSTDLGTVWTDYSTFFSTSLSGLISLPNGFKLQWITANLFSNADMALVWPVAFPIACLGVSGIVSDVSDSPNVLYSLHCGSITRFGLNVRGRSVVNGGAVATSGMNARLISVGY